MFFHLAFSLENFKNYALYEIRNFIYNISKGISVTRKSNLKTEMMI